MRDQNGRFLKGGPPGPGRPSKAAEREYLDAIRSKCSPDDWGRIVLKAVEQAKQGDRHARNWLAEYLVPHPDEVPRVEIDIHDAEGKLSPAMLMIRDLEKMMDAGQEFSLQDDGETES